MTFEIGNKKELTVAAERIIEFAKDERIWLLNGSMGAGKTTLSKVIAQQLGVIDTVQSPTFSIVNEYMTEEGETIYHFDFYRLEEAEEALNIGVEEYFYSGSICLIEWAEKVEPYLPDQFLSIDIVDLGNEKRRYTLAHHGQ